MPRRTAAERHTDSAPADDLVWPPEGTALVDALVALHHPVRRRLYEMLTQDDPTTVGVLAACLGVAPGSVSHHLKVLHRAGFVEPAPELARDTRESWWRGLRRRLSWSTRAYAEGSGARAVAELAEWANLDHHTRAVTAWISGRENLPPEWRDLGLSDDNLVRATPEQFGELSERLQQVTQEWSDAVREDAQLNPEAPRRSVRVLVRAFPSEPGGTS
ncbi:ArsR/SmtB family transcription factor [Rudaeicoccus suwonensis]|nr:helix-turn-helix domain-containing protein [Rudaeicoccus suwonensis]